MSELTRREMLVLTSAAVACACCGDALGDDKAVARPATLVIGKLADFSTLGYYDTFRDKKIMVNRLADRLVVLSATCTHKGCTVKIDVNDPVQLRCPCHKGLFGEQGTPIDGPPKSALVRFAVSIDDTGIITADTTKSFGEREWDKPEAFVAITPKP